MTSHFVAGSLLAGALFTFFQGAIEITTDAVEVEPVTMRLESLSFDGDVFHQRMKVTGRSSIRGEWAAKIVRDGIWLCGGGGVSAYTSRKITMLPDTWAGDNCPALQDGDRATASWQWVDATGLVRGISGELVIGQSRAP